MGERRGLTIKDLLIRLILIIIFIFLLIWLFPMPNLKPLNNQIFADNVGKMKDVAKSYYTTERLPQNVDDSKKMTLKEMIDNHLILPLTDSKGKTCNTNESYVEVTKAENEYVIKVNLSCSDAKNYVIEHFGCYDICSDTCKALEVGTTTGTTTYKTSRKRVSTSATYTKRATTTKKITEGWSTTKINAGKLYEYQFVKDICTDKFDSYSCPTGYALVGNKCMRHDVDTEVVEATETKTIVSNVDTQDAEVISSSTTETKDPIMVDGIKTKTGNAGYKETEYTAQKATVYTSVNAIASSTDDIKPAIISTKTTRSSYEVVQNYSIVDADVIYPETEEVKGWKYVGTKTSTDPSLSFDNGSEKLVLYRSWQELACVNCEKELITYYQYFRYKYTTISTSTTGSIKYTCDSHPGYTLDGTKCKKATGTTKKCPNSRYTDTGSDCVITESTLTCSSYGSEYKLNESAKTCTKTTTKYTCPAGAKETSDPKVCETSSIDYVCPSNMEKRGSGSSTTCVLKSDYFCPANTNTTTYTLNGTICTAQIKTSVPTCEDGYTLSADKKSCVKQGTDTKYSCKKFGDDYTLEGNKCTKVTNTEVITYTCDKDYTLDGKECIKTVESKDTIAASKNYKTTCNQEYKWSTSTTVDGWSYTGNKRQIN